MAGTSWLYYGNCWVLRLIVLLSFETRKPCVLPTSVTFRTRTVISCPFQLSHQQDSIRLHQLPCLLLFCRITCCPSHAASVLDTGAHNLRAMKRPLHPGSWGMGSLTPNMCPTLLQPLSLIPRECQHPTIACSLNNPLAALPNELLSHGYFGDLPKRKEERRVEANQIGGSGGWGEK